MSVVRLKNLSLGYEGRQILRNIFLRAAAGERVALVGANGSGKSSILKLIVRHAVALGQGTTSTHIEAGAGGLPEVEGDVELNRDVTVGYFSQFSQLDDERAVEDILLDTFAEVRGWESELEAIDEAMGAEPDGDELERLLLRQADLFELMTQHDGWSYRNSIDTVLSKLGFDAVHRARPVGQLSGGWRNRASLAQILLEEPDLLLLDEPTNYLDVQGIAWLETWIGRLPGAVIAVSHDRHFLDSIVSRMVEIQNYKLHLGPLVHDQARRSAGHPRAQRLRQVDPAASHHGRARTRRGRGALTVWGALLELCEGPRRAGPNRAALPLRHGRAAAVPGVP